MIVSPELISARSAPCASPLNSCERKLGQLIIAGSHPSEWFEAGAGRRREREAAGGKLPPAVSSRSPPDALGIRTQIATERVWTLHQRRARDDLDDVVEVFLVLHVFRRFAPDDDHRPYELVVFLAEIDFTDGRLDLAALLVGFDDVRRVESAGILHGLRPQREFHVRIVGAPFRLV